MTDSRKDDKEDQISLNERNKKANLKNNDDDLEQRTNAALNPPEPENDEEGEEEEEQEQEQAAEDDPKKKDDKDAKASADHSDNFAADLADTISKIDPEKALSTMPGKAFNYLFGKKEDTTLGETPEDPGTRITNDPAGEPKPKPGAGENLSNDEEQGRKRKLGK